MNRKPTEEEKQKWFGGENQTNVAIICGKISGQNGTSLVVLDFDTIPNYEAFSIQAGDKLGYKLCNVTPVVRTGRGYQVYFYIEDPTESRQFGSYPPLPANLYNTVIQMI